MNTSFDIEAFKNKIGVNNNRLTTLIKKAHAKKCSDQEVHDAVKYIMENNKDEKVIGECLHKAACFGYIRLARLLLDSGIKIDTRDKQRNTPLINACHTFHPEVARFLVKRGAFINAKNKFGWSATQYACMSADKELVKYLIEHGAKVDYLFNDDKKNIINNLTKKNDSKYDAVLEYLRNVQVNLLK